MRCISLTGKSSIPPPFTGYWAWVRDELRTKANEKWVTSEISAIKRMIDDTKVTAVDARRSAEKPYICAQERTIEELRDFQKSLTNWKIPIIISVVLLILSAAGQYYTLKDSVDDGTEDREQVQETLKKIEQKQEETSKVVQEMKIREMRQDDELNEEIRVMFKEIVEELKDSDTSTRSRRRNRAPASSTRGSRRVVSPD